MGTFAYFLVGEKEAKTIEAPTKKDAKKLLKGQAIQGVMEVPNVYACKNCGGILGRDGLISKKIGNLYFCQRCAGNVAVVNRALEGVNLEKPIVENTEDNVSDDCTPVSDSCDACRVPR